jgi:hypothetical protein
MAWLCNTSWDGIQPREVGKLAISATPVGFVATFSMYTEGQKCVLEFDHFGDLMAKLEIACRDYVGKWSPLDKGEGARKLKSERRKLIDKEEAKDDDEVE